MLSHEKQPTTFQVNSAITLIMPCAKPKNMETGRNTISYGLRLSKPILLTTLVSKYQIIITTQPQLRDSGFHVSEAKWNATKKKGSVTRPSERKVAVYMA